MINLVKQISLKLLFLVEAEQFERHRFSFLYENNKLLQRRLKHLVIDKRILGFLLQNIIILKLNIVGIFTRNFYSEDLKQIFVVMKAQDNLLRQVAEVKNKNKI